MRPQSLLFDRAAGWTVEKAKAWAKSHGFKSGKVDVTDQYVRLRQFDPKGFAVKRTVPFGKGIRAVVAREENMAAKKKTTRRPAKRTAAKRKPKVTRRHAPKRRTAKVKSPRTVAARRHRPRRVRETGRFVAAKRRRPRRVRETAKAVGVAEARRHRPRKHGRRKASKSYVMEAKRRRPRHKVSAWRGDSAGHSKAAKKGWRTRKGGKSSKTTKKAAESRRRPRRYARESTLTVQARRRPKRHHRRARETTKVRSPHRSTVRSPHRSTVRTPRHYARSPSRVVQSRRRPKHHRARETTRVAEARRRTYKSKRRVVRAPSFSSIARTTGNMALEVGTAAAAYLVADAVDRFLATYDPAGAQKPAHKFTSDGTGTLANALNVASPPDLLRYGSLGAMALLPLVGSLFIKKPAIRSSVEGMGVGAGIKLAATVWSNVLMPLLVGKDTSVPALQKSWIARLYPAEVSATLNMKSGTAAVSSATKAGTLSDGPQAGVGKDAGPFALADRWGRRERWVAPPAWPVTAVPAAPVTDTVAPGSIYPDGGGIAVAVQPSWPARWGERHRWGLRGVGAAIEDMHHTILHHTGVHPAHAINATMHAAAEPYDLTLALQRALPHLKRELLQECAHHLHPHVARMHAHARYPREHGEWVDERAAEGFPAPSDDAPEHEWSEWHGKRAAAGLPQAPMPPELPPIAPATPAHLRSRHEWRPKYDKEITYERFPTVPQVLGIGAGGPSTAGNPGQPGLGDSFANAAQSAAASVPNMPLENAVNVTAYAAAEPFSCERAIERAMPLIRSELARYCAENMSPHIRQLHEQVGVPLPAATPSAAPVVVTEVPAPSPVIEFVPSPPPPSWTKGEAEWHDEERRNWEHAHAGAAHPAVVVATTRAAEAAAAPHPEASKPAVQAAVKTVSDKAAQAASAAPPGTPAAEVHAAATQAAQAGAAEHPAVADHPAVQAAAKAAAAAAPAAAAAAAAPKTGTAGVGFPPRHLQVGPTKLPSPQGPQPVQSECGCLDDSPYLGFVGDEVEEDLLYAN